MSVTNLEVPSGFLAPQSVSQYVPWMRMTASLARVTPT